MPLSRCALTLSDRWTYLRLMACIQDIARFRPELRLLISSATMDAEKFSEYFDDAHIFYGVFILILHGLDHY